MAPVRIHVIGAGGSGKTTLARRLSEQLSVRWYELDVGADPEAIAREPTWITEGIFLWGIEPLLEAADLIVWLDLPFRISARRIASRHIRLSAAGRNPHKGVALLFRFLLSQRRYFTAREARPCTGPQDWDCLSRVATEQVLDDHRDKVARLRSSRDVNRWSARHFSHT